MALLKELARAAAAIKNAKALIITAGSGMGVDSGLPDFRGEKGLWRAYPPLQKLNIDLPSMSNPRWFYSDPKFAWGFFGHRFNMYKNTNPHTGFQILLDWGKAMEYGYFVFTSNVDGHFQKAGYDVKKICECHGSINHMQLVESQKDSSIWSVNDDYLFDVNEETLRLKNDLPLGPPYEPEFLARPNILMFSDWDWISARTDEQEKRYFKYQLQVQESGVPFVVIEIGSGLAVPTVRTASENLIGPQSNSVLIRINPKEARVPDSSRNIALKMRGLEAIHEINELLKTD